MNFTTLVSSVCVSLAITTAASAQWSSNGSVLNIGVGGVYGNGSRTVVGPNGQRFKDSYNTNTTAFNVGFGAAAANGNGYAPMYGGGGYGVVVPPAVVMPYYGGQCAPVYVPYNPFTRAYINPCYAPQVIAPAAYCPQMPVCW